MRSLKARAIEFQIPNFRFKITNQNQNRNSKIENLFRVAASKFYGQAKGLISTGQLSTLLHLHIQPINLVVYQESRGQD